MTETNIKTTSYEIGTKFMVDIVETDNTYHAWIYRKDYGVKCLMFGVRKKQQKKASFILTVINNLPDYMNVYNETWDRRVDG